MIAGIKIQITGTYKNKKSSRLEHFEKWSERAIRTPDGKFEGGYVPLEFDNLQDMFDYLIGIGEFDEINCIKRHTTEKVVMDRLTK